MEIIGIILLGIFIYWLDGGSLKEAGWSRQAIKEHRRGSYLIVLIPTFVVGIISFVIYLALNLIFDTDFLDVFMFVGVTIGVVFWGSIFYFFLKK